MQSPHPLHLLTHVPDASGMGAEPLTKFSTPVITFTGAASASPEKGTVGQTSTQRPHRVQASSIALIV
jgi:hypothetical protein